MNQFVKMSYHPRKKKRKKKLKMVKKRLLAKKKAKRKSLNLMMMAIRFQRRNPNQLLSRRTRVTESLQIKIR